MTTLKGKSVSQGYAIGKAYCYDRQKPEISKKNIKDTVSEIERFEAARSRACEELDSLYEKAKNNMEDSEAEIFEIHRMMLDDLDYIDSVHQIINNDSVCAEYAVNETSNIFAENFASMEDNEYMQARATDVKDISDRVIAILLDKNTSLILSEPSIIVTDDLMPSETVSIDRSMLLAIVTSKGSANSHTSILARTLGIPAVVMTEGTDCISNGDNLIVDASAGCVYICPEPELIEQYDNKIRQQREHAKQLNDLIGKENITADGSKTIKIFANIGSPSDVDSVLSNDAGGIGLFRSEFLYLESETYPDEEKQFKAYKEVLERMQGREVVIRTLDIGADKKIDYFELPKEDNPALGFRAIRICLERPEIFKTQLRALLRASAFGNLLIMFPMIASEWEVDAAISAVNEVKDELKRENIEFDENVRLGIMIETPAAAVMSDVLAKKVDFFSIGTNDLTQYTLAADRQNETISRFVDTHNEAVLRLIELTAKNAHEAGIWVGICGELAADTDLTERFLRMGIDELSMSPKRILDVRAKVRSIKL